MQGLRNVRDESINVPDLELLLDVGAVLDDYADAFRKHNRVATTRKKTSQRKRAKSQ